MNVGSLESRPVGLDDEAANQIVLVFHLRPDDGDGAGGDPHLLAVQDVVVAVLTRAGAHRAWIRAGVRLGQAEAAEDFAERHLRQVLLLLLLAAEGVDGIHAEPRLNADERAHTAVAALQLLRHQAVFDGRHAGAAVALQAGAVEAELAHRLDQLFGEATVAIAQLDDGDEVLFDELAGVVAYQLLVVGEQRIEVDKIHAFKLECHARSLYWKFADEVNPRTYQAEKSGVKPDGGVYVCAAHVYTPPRSPIPESRINTWG